MEDWQACSRVLYHILDNMGYSGSMIDYRRKFYTELAKRFSRETGYQILLSGSKGEGLTNYLQSDVDWLLFWDDICGIFETADGERTTKTEDPTRYMFKVEKEWSPPGYCMLILVNSPSLPVRWEMIECSLSVIDKGVICLKSESFLRFINDRFKTECVAPKAITGPSQPATTSVGIDLDLVPTFSCPCSVELNAWYKRPRHHVWPSQSLQDDIISTPANVVAVGSKESIFRTTDWRFCFNRAENKLMSSLNPTQSKVYVALKMILKEYLKPEKKEITSYVMKNIVLWICETNPSSSFTPSTLLSWIYVGLQTLKGHIESGNLPYYMIPGRNLFEGKFLDDITKTEMLDKLSMLLESGVCFVHVCKTIQLGLNLYNESMLEDFGWKRNLVEIYRFPDEYLPTELKTKRESLRLAGIDNPDDRVLVPDLDDLITKEYTEDELWKLFFYRQGFFLNPDKADSHAQDAADFLSEQAKDVQ